MKKKRIVLTGLILCMLLFAGCREKEATDKSRLYQIYVVNKEETRIYSNEYTAESTEPEDLTEELMQRLSLTPERLEYKAPLAGGFELLDYTLEDGQLILNFDEKYREQPVTTETLVRAAIVRTMTQIKGIDYVSFQVRNDPLTDSAGNVIGIMSADMFIDNAGNEINSLERVTLRLYFANGEGDKLVETNRKMVYNTNVSLERLVVEQVVGGPSEQVKGMAYPTINPETKINGVTVRDGTCYVNFNEAFLTQPYSVTSDAAIYSLTNSLVELPNINKVQIAINGDTGVMYRENLSLAAPFERNLDIVITAK